MGCRAYSMLYSRSSPSLAMDDTKRWRRIEAVARRRLSGLRVVLEERLHPMSQVGAMYIDLAIDAYVNCKYDT